MILDFFNHPISEGDIVLAPIGKGLRLCRVNRLNKTSVSLVKENTQYGKSYRILPEDIIVMSGETLMLLKLSGKVS
jgi:hypothetical protein